MSASTSDKITDVRNAARPNSARASAPRSAGGTTLSCDNLTGWPTASKVHFVTYQIDSLSNPVAGTQLDCYGIVSGNSIGSITVVDGTDTGNSVNDVVEMLPTAAWGQDLTDGLTAEHARTGAHAKELITSRTEDTSPDSSNDFLLSYDDSAATLKKIKPSSLGIGLGWVPISEIWTYSSSDATNATYVVTVPSDATTKYSAGMRVKLTDSGTKYFIITKVAATALTLYGGTDYTLTGGIITSPFYSIHKAPLGFPLDPTKWTVRVTYTDDNTTSSATYAQVGSHQISIPTGCWEVFMQATIYGSVSGNNSASGYIALSTATNSASDTDLTYKMFNPAVASLTGTVSSETTMRKILTLTSATTYYQVFKRDTALTWGVRGSDSRNIIEAVCAYL